ncbi:MAG: hypothetical protein ABW089_11840 [Sedimenticola sp.]
MLKKIILSVTIFPMFISLVSYAGEKLVGEELKQLHMDKTFDMTHYKNGHGLVYFGSDGDMNLVMDSGTTWEGKWWVNDAGNKRCFKKNEAKKHWCVFVEKRNNGEYALVSPKTKKTTVNIHRVIDGNKISQ